MTPPLAPRRFSWAVAGRLARGLAVAFMLVWVVGLVAWPERHRDAGRVCVTPGWGFVFEDDGGCRRVNCAGPCDFAAEHLPEGRKYTWSVIRRKVPGAFRVTSRDASLSLLPDLLGM